jgi:hypothetical protein
VSNVDDEDGRLRFVQALQLASTGLSREELIRRLDETPVAVVVGNQTAGSLAAQTTALTAVNLLGRLFRRLIIVAPAGVGVQHRLPFIQGQFAAALAAFAGRVHPDVRTELRVEPPADGIVLHVSDPDAVAGPGRVYCEGSGWLARVARHPLPSLSTADENPVGPLVAASLGVAELFKLVLGDVLTSVVPAEEIAFSSLTFKVGDLDVGPPLRHVQLPESVLVGAGSIGSAFLWGLAHLPDASGKLTITDPDRLKRHNLDRAILVLDGVAAHEPEKAPWARDMMKPWTPKLDITPFSGTISQYVDSLPHDYRLPLAISAVDSIESRRDIQDALPERILNASTGPTKIEVSRHHILGEGPCLYCLYIPEVLERSPLHIAMDRTGFEQRYVAELMMPDSKRLLSDGNVRSIEQRNSLPPGTLEQYVGQRLPELLRAQIWYSQAPISTEGGQALVTTAFVSALAGFLLLAETIKEADPVLSSYRLNRVYEQDLLATPNEFVYPGERDVTGYCLCHDPLRLRLYQEKHLALESSGENRRGN